MNDTYYVADEIHDEKFSQYSLKIPNLRLLNCEYEAEGQPLVLHYSEVEIFKSLGDSMF